MKVQFIRFLNSLCNVSKMRLIDKRARVFKVQKLTGINRIGIIKLNQFIANILEVEGSKVENKLVIIILILIFCNFYFFLEGYFCFLLFFC